MLKNFGLSLLFVVCGLWPSRGWAQTAALIAVADQAQVSEVQLAKVMAEESSLWLSVRLRGATRLALVSEQSTTESAVAADAWLRALDFSTRMRVAPPPGPLPNCGSSRPFELADSGRPEPRRVVASEVFLENSEVGLRRRLSEAGLPADAGRIAHFTARAQPPFRVAIYEVALAGGSTDALRLIDRGHAERLPRLELSAESTVPLSVIVLAKEGVHPFAADRADPSEFAVVYRAVDATSDYSDARGDWRVKNPTRWLSEVQASRSLFADTVFPSAGRIDSVISRYLGALPDASASGCEAAILAAHERASTNVLDFECDHADDLSRSLTEVGFAELLLNRWYGTLGGDGEISRDDSGAMQGPLVFATDLDQSGCAESVLPPVEVTIPPRDSPVPTTPVVVNGPGEPYPDPTDPVRSEVSCSGPSSPASSNESCSGDSSTSDSENDSCSGDSSRSDSSGDSCSGDSSAGDSEDDSCSGDSSTSDSEGDSCDGDSTDSKSDGDSCTFDSAESNPARAKSALGADTSDHKAQRRRPRPKNVRLSLLTLLAAALSLPLRRLSASR